MVDIAQLKVLGLLGLAIVCLLLGLAKGAIAIDLVQLFLGTGPDLQKIVFNEIRSPRVVLAGLVGATLALSGATLQGLFRNPLADPGLIGVSSGAALGAVGMIVFGTQLGTPTFILPYALPLAAVLGAFLVTIFLFYFAAFFGGFNILTH